MQTNSITWSNENRRLEATVQNDASDSRKLLLKSGREIVTTNYVRGEYDILAVPLFPFTGTWKYAYLWNINCAASTHRKYDEETRSELLATSERITWPLESRWTTDLIDMLGRGEPEYQMQVKVEELDTVEEIEPEL